MSTKPHILIVTDLFPANEQDYAGIYVVDYAKSVQPWFDVTVLHARMVGIKKGITEETIFGIKTIRYAMEHQPLGKLKKIVAYGGWFKKAAASVQQLSGISLIHAHGSVLSGNVARLIAEKRSIPYFITEHTGPFSTISNSKLKLKYCRKAVNGCKRLLTVSKHTLSEMRLSGVDVSKAEVSYNPVNTDFFKLENTERQNRMVFVSRLDEFKGGLRSLKAFHEANLAQWRLTIIGEGEELEAIKKYINQHHLNEVVELKGLQTKDQISSVLQSAKAFVFPSRHESFGLVAVEAIICGTPVISTDRTAPSEYVQHGTNGLLVDPDSILEIKNAMISIASGEMRFNSKEISQNAVNKFGLEAFGLYLKQLYLS